MLPGLRSDLTARPPASSSAAVRPSNLNRSDPLVTCLSVSDVPMFPDSPPSYIFLPPPPARLPPDPSALLLLPVLSRPVPPIFGPVLSVAVVRDKRDNKSETKKRGE